VFEGERSPFDKKLHVLNQVAVNHLVVAGSMLKSVPLNQNLIVNLDA
jgi:hypothetical protein